MSNSLLSSSSQSTVNVRLQLFSQMKLRFSSVTKPPEPYLSSNSLHAVSTYSSFNSPEVFLGLMGSSSKSITDSGWAASSPSTTGSQKAANSASSAFFDHHLHYNNIVFISSFN